MSNEINELAKALNLFQAEVVTVSKTAENPFFKSKYAPLDAIMLAAQPVLTKHGLAVSQLIDNIDGQSALTTTLMHTSGQSISSTMPLLLAKQDAQGQGSAITYARRYSYAAILGVVIDEDDDGNRGSVAPATKRPVASPTASTGTGEVINKAQESLLFVKARGASKLTDAVDIHDWFLENFGKMMNEVTRDEMDSILEALQS